MIVEEEIKIFSFELGSIDEFPVISVRYDRKRDRIRTFHSDPGSRGGTDHSDK